MLRTITESSPKLCHFNRIAAITNYSKNNGRKKSLC